MLCQKETLITVSWSQKLAVQKLIFSLKMFLAVPEVHKTNSLITRADSRNINTN